jgi:hypothetical protein
LSDRYNVCRCCRPFQRKRLLAHPYICNSQQWLQKSVPTIIITLNPKTHDSYAGFRVYNFPMWAWFSVCVSVTIP